MHIFKYICKEKTVCNLKNRLLFTDYWLSNKYGFTENIFK